jgi:cbb3-type cytochrome oxidase cytochrome c subunit
MRKYLTGRATNRNIQILVAVILLLVSIANLYSIVTYAVQAHNRG